MSSSLNIAVIGAGTAGLAAAAFLAQDGHRVTVYEKFPVARPVGAGLLLQPTGLAILATLGLDKQAIAEGAPIHRLYGRVVNDGRVVFDIAYADLAPHLFGLGIHRGVLFFLLHGKALAAGVTIQTDTAITGLSYDEKGLPRVTDLHEVCYGPFDLVVDAHGSRSILRTQHADITSNKFYPYGAIWGICRDVERAFAGDTLTQRYQRARHMIGVMPVGHLNGGACQSIAFFWSLRVADYETWKEQGMESWRAQVTALWPETKALVAQFKSPEDMTLATYSDMILRCAHRPRLAFIGDAAHCTSPQLGQGANLALIDAYALAASLRENRTVEEALPAYSKARKNHVRFYQTASRWLTPFFQSDSRAMPFIRDTTYGILCRLPYIRPEMLRTLAGVKTGLFGHLNPGQWDAAYDVRTPPL